MDFEFLLWSLLTSTHYNIKSYLEYYVNISVFNLTKNEAMKIWRGNVANVEAAQSVFLKKAKLCSEASLGKINLQNQCVKSI